jgi:RNA polymerase sigma factor (sigma-70 family)
MEPNDVCRPLLGMDLEAAATDAELWSLVLAEDGQAFGLVFDRYRDRVFRQSLRLVHSSHEAEDVTAMVFLEAWRCRKRVRTVNGSMLGWLLVTTNNVARSHLRSTLRYRRLLGSLPKTETVPDHSEAVAEAADASSLAAGVQGAFFALNRRDQEILTLCVLEDLPIAEVAQVLRIPSGTVKSRLSRAKQHLVSLLGDTPFTPPTAMSPEGSI